MRGATIVSCVVTFGCQIFQSTHPMRGATLCLDGYTTLNKFQSTHPMRGATLLADELRQIIWDFNPRTPCGVRLNGTPVVSLGLPFQSTHPMRGATVPLGKWLFRNDISIHAPHAGCDVYAGLALDHEAISIHAPHAGCDQRQLPISTKRSNFNPRTPCGVRPYKVRL